jgi:mRNA-degrading endonuclease toxin of MazEF toxin-antitoxin module
MESTEYKREAEHSGHPKRGEIYLTAPDPAIEHEIGKAQPVLIIQNDITNQFDATTLVAPITSTVRQPLSPLHVLLPAEPSTGLDVPSVAVFTQIRAVDRGQLVKKLGEASAAAMVEVDRAIQAAFGLPASESGPRVTRAISESTADLKTGRYEG